MASRHTPTNNSTPNGNARSSGAIRGLCNGGISRCSGGHTPNVQKAPGNRSK